MKWSVFAAAPDQITGEMWCELLRSSGVNCRFKDPNPSFFGPSIYSVRLMAPENEKDLALCLLAMHVDLNGEGKLEPDALPEVQEDEGTRSAPHQPGSARGGAPEPALAQLHVQQPPFQRQSGPTESV